jgi:hypothetical protein
MLGAKLSRIKCTILAEILHNVAESGEMEEEGAFLKGQS